MCNVVISAQIHLVRRAQQGYGAVTGCQTATTRTATIVRVSLSASTETCLSGPVQDRFSGTTHSNGASGCRRLAGERPRAQGN